MTVDVLDPPPRGSAAEGQRSDADFHRRAVPATPQQLATLREQLDGWALRSGLSSETHEALQLAVYEAMANVVVHAYRSAAGVLDLLASIRGDSVVVIVADRGRWQPAARPGPLHGRGLPLIRALSATAVIEATAAGTTVTMTFSRGKP
ncbi:Anti-sigma regulatory factor (Ser/Thr protein kinase) [Amycolatopsis pretoriensis]|uniref:Anti-sigma regulatory factor (Ser/Thr protein kinase) n=1 Tax=Amycolatopsis pretoriensis TaxID=218821 RepID=A0A1H5RGB5_9PSEU|nr:ATP-binding protein [Amycolatopsis pretoriensis]SEF37395.1 Anti-sigma regulatory factor (Ser/Thr protein kinase) [Amycolatopsis pretoriensis]